METRVTEVADGVHQLTTVVPDAPVVVNQYRIVLAVDDAVAARVTAAVGAA